MKKKGGKLLTGLWGGIFLTFLIGGISQSYACHADYTYIYKANFSLDFCLKFPIFL